MWDKVIYRMFQGCMMTILVGVTGLFGVRVAKQIKREVKHHG